MKIDIKKDGDGGLPLYRQIAEEIYGNIEKGTLTAGERLPTVRGLAKTLGVNSGTVAAAYKYLENRRLVFSKTGSGTYVSGVSTEDIIVSGSFEEKEEEYVTDGNINFSASNLNSELFPVSEFKRALNSVLDEERGRAFGYEDPKGSPGLRETLARKHGVSSSKIQIISGAQQGIDVIARALLSYGDAVIVEKPTYMGAVGAFVSRGAEVINVKMEPDGMDLNELERLLPLYKPKLVYVMTYYQTPTTYSYSLERKRRLLELSYKYGFYIIEEDNLSDFNYSKEKILSLKTLDYKNKVIYIKSFSKVLMPGLRLGYMVMPKGVTESIVKAKLQADMGTSGFIQSAFNRYLKSGSYEKHILKIRDCYYRKYWLTKNCIDLYLSRYVTYREPKGGLSFWLVLKKGKAEVLKEKLLKESVVITTGSAFSNGIEDFNAYRLSFSEVSDEEISEGIKIIGKISGSAL
ncbi:MAG: PLP-dependent aminotransferase family protein [Clostridiales bacterium]|nr:PLP-dependent aminotransferase family protein [Clostridiales bacterium]